MERDMTMNLQLFAADDAAGSGEAQSDSQNTQEQTSQQETHAEEQQERRYTQAEVDRIVAQRLARQQRGEEQRINAAREEARSEAERLASMSAEQRAQHEREQAANAIRERENAIAQREREVTRRELRNEAISTLTARGLPTELESLLDYSSADACNASIETAEKAFRHAVQTGIDARLKASGVTLHTSTGGKPDYSKMSDEEYYAETLKKQK